MPEELEEELELELKLELELLLPVLTSVYAGLEGKNRQRCFLVRYKLPLGTCGRLFLVGTPTGGRRKGKSIVVLSLLRVLQWRVSHNIDAQLWPKAQGFHYLQLTGHGRGAQGTSRKINFLSD